VITLAKCAFDQLKSICFDARVPGFDPAIDSPVRPRADEMDSRLSAPLGADTDVVRLGRYVEPSPLSAPRRDGSGSGRGERVSLLLLLLGVTL
jgi:hypothetical protein